MSTANSDLTREAIRRTLAHGAGVVPDASAVAEATLSTWRQVAARLAPVIGARGVDALFNRSLHLTSSAFPWLKISGDHGGGGDGAPLLASLQSLLAGRETDDAAEACHSLLVTFVVLLTTLIGESLTERLLGPVWVPLAPAPNKETEK